MIWNKNDGSICTATVRTHPDEQIFPVVMDLIGWMGELFSSVQLLIIQFYGQSEI